MRYDQSRLEAADIKSAVSQRGNESVPGRLFDILTKAPMAVRSYSAMILALGGAILMALGLYFVFVRPPLLPEDLRFMGTSLAEVQQVMPGLLIWLRRVFWVMGGYMFATGLLTFFVAFTTFRARTRGVVVIVALSGLTSIGLMAVLNFVIASDFKWLILSFTLPWAVALAIYSRKRNDS